MPKGFRWEACQATIQETGISKCNNFLVISFLDLERPKKGKIISYFLTSNKFFCQVTRWKVTIRPWKWRFSWANTRFNIVTKTKNLTMTMTNPFDIITTLFQPRSQPQRWAKRQKYRWPRLEGKASTSLMSRSFAVKTLLWRAML